MILILMGVSGSGKTTLGRLLAERLGWPFYDGDDFHSPANVEKMTRGLPLTDDDRWAWLDALATTIRQCLAAEQSAILACSALKHLYRERLCVDPAVRFVHLTGSYALILERMQARPDHFMKPAMLVSQFNTLEPPTDALTVDIATTPEQAVQHILHALQL
jgi:gluconokinase